MQQYHELLEAIQDKGWMKPPARANMPGTQSLFGYQFRHDMANGFPLVTTKKIHLKSVIYELLWFLKGDTNVKFLIDVGVNIWNQDAYHYYAKVLKSQGMYPITFDGFVDALKKGHTLKDLESVHLGIPVGYTLGDCGFQYGRVWREWEADTIHEYDEGSYLGSKVSTVDQIKKVLNTLMTNPESRRHLVTAIDPGHENDLALYWCHAFFQFNCRPLSISERTVLYADFTELPAGGIDEEEFDKVGIPKYYLDLQLYQRSADVFLGVPFNIASYAMILQIFAEVCNMIPGDFIHTFGDVHIYDNHRKQVELQLTRDVRPLPKFSIKPELIQRWSEAKDIVITNDVDLLDFSITGYDPHPAIKGELSTGMK